MLILQGNIISVHAVNKLYKRKLFADLRYPKGKYHEDSFIIVDLLSECQKVSIDSTQNITIIIEWAALIQKHFQINNLSL